jgi:crotonobetainyl-CoA:carnitine CoA-transferase CaiB-like acyl-CoA transferase
MLSPYRVLDLTDGRAELASFMLAGLGADVIKVELPGGSVSRKDSPLDLSQPPGLQSLHFHAYNRGKRSIELDLTTTAGRADFLALVATADFVFENAEPGAMDTVGLGFAALRAVRPDLVYVAITPFGQDGPYAHHLATDLTLSAMGGAVALNGEPDRRPVRITVPQTWLHAAAEAALAALVAHHRRLQTGDAQFVDVSVQTAVFWTGLNAMTAHDIQGRNIERNGTVLQLSTLVTPLVYPCADGDVVLIATTATIVEMIPWMIDSGIITQAWADAEDWVTYETRMLTGGELVYPVLTLRERLIEFTRSKTKDELFKGGLARRMTIAPVNTTADVMAFEQLSIRDFWQSLQMPSGKELRTAGAFVRMSGKPVAWPFPTPKIGEHTAELMREIRSVPTAPKRSVVRKAAMPENIGAEAATPMPFAGVKFADFSWIGVGPITAKTFADHGALVVHIESDNPIDRLRMVGPFKDDIPGPNRCQFFGAFNTSKRSLQLNLKHPDGIAIAKRLLQWADVCLDSFTAGTMDALGLGYDVARTLNPGIIVASTCLLGQTGPAARLSGYGYHAAAISGFYEVTGWNDRPPAGPFNAYTDTIAPRFLATSIMAALDHRRRTGEGQFIDQAQMESSLHFLAPELLNVQLTGVNPRRSGNESPTASPHDVYPCMGHDEWCAIAVETDQQWRALRAALGNPAWAMSPALDTLAGRRAAQTLVDRELSAFSMRYAPRDLMHLLQAAGVPAGMVQRSSDHMHDPQLAHRDFFRRLQHPEMGEVAYEGHQYRISGYDNGPIAPAPCLGEHSFEVLQEVLGMEDDAIVEAMSNGAVG